ncbi:MAG TPA: PAS domain-containing protein [Acidobacteriaceae bacterium]|nr:PAS domain-containing protein [Acidobacteriaceae bacterium]
MSAIEMDRDVRAPQVSLPALPPRKTSRVRRILWSFPARLLLSVVAAIIAYLIRVWIIHFTGSLPPFIIFNPMVLLMALWAGVWAGLTVTAVSAVLVDYLALPPTGSLHIAHSSDVFAFFHFCAVGVFTSVLSELYRRSLQRYARLQTEEAVRTERIATAEQSAAATMLREQGERLRTQADRLRETERTLSTMIDFVPQLVWMCAPDGRNIFFNKRWVDYTGLSPEESAGHAWIVPFHPEDQQDALDAWSEAVRTGTTYQVESRLRAADGRYRWFLIRGTPMRSADGRIQRWFGTCTDVEDLKRADAALEMAKQRFELAIRPTPVTVFNQDRDLRMTWVYNPAPGYDPSAIMGKRDSEYLERADEAAAIEAIKRTVIDTGEPQRAEVTAHLNGLPRIYDMVVEPLRDGAGAITGITCAAIDVTDRRREIVELKQAQEALIKSEKIAAVGRLTSSIAHEINNPLESVMNSLFLARTSPECPESVTEFLLMAEEELQRVAHVTRQTLGFYRESASSGVPLTKIVDSAVDLHRRKIVERNARVNKQYRGDFAATTVPGELRQVFSNLLANSLDAIPLGGAVTIRSSRVKSLETGGPELRIVVADNGSGIETETRKRIFEPLFTTKDSGGSGLGLWVVRQLVEKHGGRIAVRSCTGGRHCGTSFVLTLPEQEG